MYISNKYNLITIIGLILLFVLPCLSIAQSSTTGPINADRFSIYGHLRPAFTFIESRSNSNSESSLMQHQVRARLNSDYRITDNVQLNTRLVLRLSSETGTFRFWEHPYAPTSSGLDNGKMAIDLLNIRWDASPVLQITAGRMQHAFQLRGLIAKSFDRYHSQNLASTWSNGIQARWSAFKSWDLHAIIQYNHPKGSGSVYQQPLNFESKSSRFSWFAAVENTQTNGIWNQLGLSASIFPGAITIEGKESAYMLFTARAGIKLPVNLSWMKMSAGTELAFAPNVPEPAQFGLQPDSPLSSNAIGWQVAINFEEIFEKNAFSFLYGYSEPGMLLAPSFRNNSDTWEVRFQHKFTSTISTEIRYRIRNQLYKPEQAIVKRLDKDFYLRLTIRI